MLPAGGKIQWPPAPLVHTYQRFAEHAAWYSGDPEQLARVYGGAVSIDQYMGQPARSSRDDVGAGAFWRRYMFWARRSTALPYQRQRLHVPLAGDIAATSADLLFSNAVAIRIPEAHVTKASRAARASQDRLTQLVEEGGIRSILLEAGEAASALGGVYLRVIWDSTSADHPILNVVHSDAAVPEFQWGELTAVTFWRVVNNDPDREGVTYRLLERHEPGRILLGLYRGDTGMLGELVPITDVPETAYMADLGLTSGNEIATGISDLTAVYIPNMRPHRLDRGSDLGRSDYQGSEGMLDALDETYTSWLRDLRLARARIIVPKEYLQSYGKGKGGTFDLDQEIFHPLEGLPPGEGSITLSQFAIRVVEHQTTARDLVERIVSTAGYSAATFGISTEQKLLGPTATEVVARERRSLMTREKKTHYWQKPLGDILSVLLQIDYAVFSGPQPFRPAVIFPDSIPAEPQVMAQALLFLSQAEAVSTATKVAMAHPDWSEEQIAAEVAAIQAAPRPPGAPAVPTPDPTTGDPAAPNATDGTTEP